MKKYFSKSSKIPKIGDVINIGKVQLVVMLFCGRFDTEQQKTNAELKAKQFFGTELEAESKRQYLLHSNCCIFAAVKIN